MRVAVDPLTGGRPPQQQKEHNTDLDQVEAIMDYPNTRRTLVCPDGTVKMWTSLLAENFSGQMGCTKRNLDIWRQMGTVSGGIYEGHSMLDVQALEEHLQRTPNHSGTIEESSGWFPDAPLDLGPQSHVAPDRDAAGIGFTQTYF